MQGQILLPPTDNEAFIPLPANHSKPAGGPSLNTLSGAMFKEKLTLLLQIRDEEFVTWKGNFKAELKDQPVYPRPLQEKLPV